MKKSAADKGRSKTMIEIVKPPSDNRAYRMVILPNGITAMLISDGTDRGSDSSDSDSMEVDDSYLDEGEAAAALCVGVGSFNDLPEIPGFAHFMEHMVFMGSKKYPKENYFDELLANNGGESNAWTDCERTCFFFVCNQHSFNKTLDIFAQFFIHPLFNKQSVDREIMAVDCEWRMLARHDKERMKMLLAHELVEKGHPMSRFMAGNMKSLKEDPEKQAINVYEQLRSFHYRMYSAHYMTLVVHSQEALDTIEANVVKMFSKIHNHDIPKPRYIKPPFNERAMKKIFRVVPMSNIHKMEIIWALPPLMEHYRSRAAEFLGLLVSHEGAGSILSLLRRKHMALDMYGGNDHQGFVHNSTWSAFMITVKLTELGLNCFEEVLKIIFQYIYLLRIQLPSYFFAEQKHIQETNYIFYESDSLYGFVEELAESMHLYPPEHYLCGRTLYFEYNDQLIRDCLDFLCPYNMTVMLFDKKFNQLSPLRVEPWLGVKYTLEDLDSSLIQGLCSLEPNPDLMLPAPNPYIATNFCLIRGERATKFPIVVVNEPGIRMWYKKDSTFGKPTAYIFLHMMSTSVSKNTQNLVLSDVFLTIILQQLTETLFNATLAGFEYSVEGTPEGIILVLGGYSQKIQLVIEDIIKVFLQLEVTEEIFNFVVADMKQAYTNELLNPVEMSGAVRCALLEMRGTSVLEKQEEVGKITLPMLHAFIQEFYSTLFVEGFVTGNLKPEDALHVGGLVTTLVVQPLPEEEFPKPYVMVLPEGVYKICASAINKEDTNSCVVHYYQQGLATIQNICLNELLTSAMSEPLFNSLRTEQQLGYSVYCKSVLVHGVLGFIVVVECQADQFSMTQIDETIDKFLTSFAKNLENMSDSKFKDLVNAQAVQKSADDAELDDEANRYWREIVNHNYVFNRFKLEYEAYTKMTHQALLAWCRALISDRSCRKLVIMVQGNCKDKVHLCSQPQAHQPQEGEISQEGKVRGQPQESEVRGVSRLLRSLSFGKGITHALGAFQSVPRLPPTVQCDIEPVIQLKNLGSNFIANIGAFKESLSVYPYHVVKK